MAGEVYSSPAIGADGMAYVGSKNNSLCSIEKAASLQVNKNVMEGKNYAGLK